jgi:hypothetical protein
MWPVLPATFDIGRHLLEANRQYDIGLTRVDRLATEKQRRGTRRAVVVNVDDRDPGLAELLKRLLPRGRVAVDVTGICALDVVVHQARV